MWDQGGYDNAGGFVEQGLGSQANTPGGTGEKRKRAQNLCPLKIQDILSADEEGIKIEGREIGMVDVVGEVKKIDQTATKTVYTFQDNSGEIDAIHWTDADATDGGMPGSAVSEGMNGRVIGTVRSQQGKKHIMVFKILPIESNTELESHELECVYVKLKLRQLNDKENQTIGGEGGGLPNSLLSSNSIGASSMTSTSFANSKQDAVFKVLSACTREEGLSRDEMLQSLKGRIVRKELDDALDYLSGEGHIYSTTDEDHFKTTDG